MEINPAAIYQEWLKNQQHHYNSSSYFTYQYIASSYDNKYIPMPPPNITGKLHMGHALFLTLQDTLTRYYKNLKHECLWLPGLDHAGLATYDKILAYQKEHNLTYEEAQNTLPAQNKQIILDQITKLGALPDWRYLTYTLDLEYEGFARKILHLLYQKGKITHQDGQYYLDIRDYALKLKQALENNHISLIPKYELKNLTPFLDNMELWNISRQIPWGTHLPFKIKDGQLYFDDNIDESSLDTWFNSSLYPLASLMKYPELIEKFYPASLIETGSDILFFWCAKMLMMSNFIYDHQTELGLKLSEPWAFKQIYLHGIIRDKHGKKFSKSLGNGIDPLEMMEKYSPDAIRLFLASRSGPSEDIIFDENFIPSYNKFMNKIYQSARFFSIYAQKQNLENLNPHIY